MVENGCQNALDHRGYSADCCAIACRVTVRGAHKTNVSPFGIFFCAKEPVGRRMMLPSIPETGPHHQTMGSDMLVWLCGLPERLESHLSPIDWLRHVLGGRSNLGIVLSGQWPACFMCRLVCVTKPRDMSIFETEKPGVGTFGLKARHVLAQSADLSLSNSRLLCFRNTPRGCGGVKPPRFCAVHAWGTFA